MEQVRPNPKEIELIQLKRMHCLYVFMSVLNCMYVCIKCVFSILCFLKIVHQLGKYPKIIILNARQTLSFKCTMMLMIICTIIYMV